MAENSFPEISPLITFYKFLQAKKKKKKTQRVNKLGGQ